MKKIDFKKPIVEWSDLDLDGRIFIEGPITDCMQLRCKCCIDKDYTEFVCGIDVYKISPTRILVTSNLGICGLSFERFLRNLIQYVVGGSTVPERGYYFVFKDDQIYDEPEYDEEGDVIGYTPVQNDIIECNKDAMHNCIIL